MPEIKNDAGVTSELVLVAPDGICAERVVVVSGMQSAHIRGVWQEHGLLSIEDWATDDYPTMAMVGEECGYAWVLTYSPTEVTDWLLDHCRVVTVAADDHDTDGEQLAPFPEEVQGWCRRAEALALADVRLHEFELTIPADYKDSTTTTVLEAVVGKRLRDELAAVRDKIDSWRKRNDPHYCGYQGP